MVLNTLVSPFLIFSSNNFEELVLVSLFLELKGEGVDIQ